MLHRAFLVATALSLAPGSAGAQPFSQSLMQCATLFETANRWFPNRLGLPDGQARADLARAFREAAALAAVSEGRADPLTYLRRHEAQAIALWTTEDATFLFTQDFTDWAGYCATIAGVFDVEVVELLDRT